MFMEQSQGSIDPKSPNVVFKLHKSIFGLKYATRAKF